LPYRGQGKPKWTASIAQQHGRKAPAKADLHRDHGKDGIAGSR
jgi:hypothetical protein